MKKVKIEVTIFAEFSEYPTKKMNASAERQIRTWVKDSIENCKPFIPLYVEKDCHGSFLEDCTQRIKVKLK